MRLIGFVIGEIFLTGLAMKGSRGREGRGGRVMFFSLTIRLLELLLDSRWVQIGVWRKLLGVIRVHVIGGVLLEILRGGLRL
jgi:hypothetical protein